MQKELKIEETSLDTLNQVQKNRCAFMRAGLKASSKKAVKFGRLPIPRKTRGELYDIHDRFYSGPYTNAEPSRLRHFA